MSKHIHPFEEALSIPAEDLEIELRGLTPAPWDDFFINPRRLRGSDFLMRWSQGSWSEDRLVDALNKTNRYRALPYGPSGTAPSDDIREFELYFERLDAAGLGALKRPDLVVFKKSDWNQVQEIVRKHGGLQELPFTHEDELRALLALAILAVECENSLWIAAQMPDYGRTMTPQKRLNGQLGTKKSAVLPTIIIKEEDRAPLTEWQKSTGLRIHVWHAFYDLAYGIALDTAEQLIQSGQILPTIQVFQAPGGATTSKAIYKLNYHHAYELGRSDANPNLTAAWIVDKNGHVLPYVKFEGGSMQIAEEALQVIDHAAGQERSR